MKEKDFFVMIAILFLFVGILHVFRSIFSWKLVIGSAIIPMWWSYLVILFMVLLSLQALKFFRK